MPPLSPPRPPSTPSPLTPPTQPLVCGQNQIILNGQCEQCVSGSKPIAEGTECEDEVICLWIICLTENEWMIVGTVTGVLGLLMSLGCVVECCRRKHAKAAVGEADRSTEMRPDSASPGEQQGVAAPPAEAPAPPASAPAQSSSEVNPDNLSEDEVRRRKNEFEKNLIKRKRNQTLPTAQSPPQPAAPVPALAPAPAPARSAVGSLSSITLGESSPALKPNPLVKQTTTSCAHAGAVRV